MAVKKVLLDTNVISVLLDILDISAPLHASTVLQRNAVTREYAFLGVKVNLRVPNVIVVKNIIMALIVIKCVMAVKMVTVIQLVFVNKDVIQDSLEKNVTHVSLDMQERTAAMCAKTVLLRNVAMMVSVFLGAKSISLGPSVNGVIQDIMVSTA